MATKVKTGVIDSSAITSALIANASITADDLHTTLDLTGKTVTVSTATAGDNDTSVASTAYVDVAIANLADSAPSTLNTLNELAAALGDDANYATTTTAAIAGKLPLAGGTMTGNLVVQSDGGNEQFVIKRQSTQNEQLILGFHSSDYATIQSIEQGVAFRPLALNPAGGNVGIGRADPTQLLEVHKAAGGDQTVAKFSAHNYGDTGKTFIEIGTEYGDGSSRIGSFNDTGNKSVLVFDTHDATSGAFAERMRIHSSGNITNKGPDNSFVTTEYASNFAKLDVRGNGILNSKHFLISYGAGHGDANEFALKNGLGPLAFYTATIKRMTIDSLGNVGIGTATPRTSPAGAFTWAIPATTIAGSRPALYLNGSSSYTTLRMWPSGTDGASTTVDDWHVNTVAGGTSAGRLSFQPQGGGLSQAGLSLKPDGKVGIGVYAPTADLQINGVSDSRLIIYETGTSPYTSTLELSSQAIGTYGALVQYTSGAERLTISNYGRTIAATSLAGSIAFKTKTDNTTHTEGMFIHGYTGNVAIGRESGSSASIPDARLHVLGGHGNSNIRCELPAAGNGASTGIVQIQGWCSEPGNTWDGAGFGYNVDNNYNESGTSQYFMGRPNSNFGQHYFRWSNSGVMNLFGANTAGVVSTSMRWNPGSTTENFGGLTCHGTTSTNRILPNVDNVGYIGEATHRWQAIYAVAGAIQTSDEREKTEIKETTLGLDFIKDLKPISYKWIDGEQQNKGKDEREHQGLIAQQVAETVEKHGIDKNAFGGLDIQETDKYDDFHGMSYDQLVAPLIKAVQELSAKVEDLQTQLDNK